MHHADAHLDSGTRARNLGLFTTIEDFAAGRLVQAHEHVHERGLSGAVLSEQGVDLALLDAQVNVLVGEEGPEALAHVLHPQQFRHVALPHSMRTHEGKAHVTLCLPNEHNPAA